MSHRSKVKVNVVTYHHGQGKKETINDYTEFKGKIKKEYIISLWSWVKIRRFILSQSNFYVYLGYILEVKGQNWTIDICKSLELKPTACNTSCQMQIIYTQSWNCIKLIVKHKWNIKIIYFLSKCLSVFLISFLFQPYGSLHIILEVQDHSGQRSR
jgi:hypothetical protein